MDEELSAQRAKIEVLNRQIASLAASTFGERRRDGVVEARIDELKSDRSNLRGELEDLLGTRGRRRIELQLGQLPECFEAVALWRDGEKFVFQLDDNDALRPMAFGQITHLVVDGVAIDMLDFSA